MLSFRHLLTVVLFFPLSVVYSQSSTFQIAKPDTLKSTIRKDNAIFQVKLDEPARYSSGIQKYLKRIERKIRYPEKAQFYGISGTVEIAFFITRVGTIENYSIHKSLSPELDFEAIRAAKLVKNEWIPGKYNSEFVDTEIIVAIEFKLPRNQAIKFLPKFTRS